MRDSRRWILLLGALLLLLQGGRLYAQEPRGAIKSVEVEGEAVTIIYDLQGDPGTEYDIRIFLVPSRRPGAPREMEKVRGDVGKGKFVGTGRKIVWDMKEFADIREGESFLFRISVDKPGIPWYYWAGGAAVLSGVGAFVFTGKGGGTEQTVPPASNPLPPSR